MATLDNNKKGLFRRWAILGLLISCFGVYLLLRSAKPMAEFNHMDGQIRYLGDSYGKYHHARSRYLKISSYDRVFLIFIGKETGDFSPKYENVDALNIGDPVTVYYDQPPMQRNSEPDLDKGLQFLTKDGKVYYERGSKDKYGGMFLIPVGLIVSIASFVRSRRTH